jgi:hypothetical protein
VLVLYCCVGDVTAFHSNIVGKYLAQHRRTYNINQIKVSSTLILFVVRHRHLYMGYQVDYADPRVLITRSCSLPDQQVSPGCLALPR